MDNLSNIISRLWLRAAGWQNRRRIARISRQIASVENPTDDRQTVIVFNASTRLTNLSLNAAFSLLMSWGLRLSGARTIHFVCDSGMSRCILGTKLDDFSVLPPCSSCVFQSRQLYRMADIRWFGYVEDDELRSKLEGLRIEELKRLEYPLPRHDSSAESNQETERIDSVPFGKMVLPSLRWTLRLHNLHDDDQTCFLYREYIISAYNIAKQISVLIENEQPSTVVVFNGIMYPEAVVRWVAQKRNIPTITHEVGFQQFSAFFTENEATAYPIDIPQEFELSDGQNERLDKYLEHRFEGKFTMAGIRFWPEMKDLDTNFLDQASKFHQIVPVFTNVVYDTSQVHANSIFPNMFVWLDLVLDVIREHPDTLFVIRAHPDEMRPGTAKQSRETVRQWVDRNQVDTLSNVRFIASQEYISSYDLIRRSKFVVVYNSSIGLESALMGTAVLCGGEARYTQYPMVVFPKSMEEYRQKMEEFLEVESVEILDEFQQNARRFMYYQLYRASLPLNQYLKKGPRPGYVQMKSFSWKELLPENSPSIKVIVDGISSKKEFLLTEE